MWNLRENDNQQKVANEIVDGTKSFFKYVKAAQQDCDCYHP